MNLDEMKIGDLKKLSCLFGSGEKPHPYKIGQAYLIRSVTHYYTGRLEQVTEHELVLSTAAWIASTGRYYDALKNGTLDEIEPIIGNAIIGRGAICDAVEWPNNLPTSQK